MGGGGGDGGSFGSGMFDPQQQQINRILWSLVRTGTKRCVSETKKKVCRFPAKLEMWWIANKQLPAWFEVDHKITIRYMEVLTTSII